MAEGFHARLQDLEEKYLRLDTKLDIWRDDARELDRRTVAMTPKITWHS